MHISFNVMKLVWYDGNASITDAQIIVPQHLEDFTHIMDKLDPVWPSELSRAYLESFITDKLDGERAVFSHAVIEEILLLLDLLDARKELS